MIVNFYFRHYRTTLLSVAGKGQQLPEMTSMSLEVDEKANPPGAPELRSSYTFEDEFGLIIGGCYWCTNLSELSEWLTGMLWQQDKAAKVPTFSVTKIHFSQIRFNGLGELGSKRTVAA